jgi:surface protein
MNIKKIISKALLTLALLTSANSFAVDSDHFVIKVATTEANETFNFYTEDSSYDIDWDGDKTFDETGVDSSGTGIKTHTYTTAGTHTIRVRALSDININNQTDKEKYKEIVQWGTSLWDAEGLKNAFYGASNINGPSGGFTDTPNLSTATSLSSMFRDASSFNSDIGNWNTSNINDMNSIFYKATAFNQSINNWNVSSVTNFNSFFRESNFNQPLNNWNTSSANDMGFLFYFNASFNQPINNWNVSNVKIFNSAFRGTNAFDQPLDNWDTSSVENFSSMFYGANMANNKTSISSFDFSSAESLSSFLYSSGLDLNGSSWDVSGVTNMQNLFGFGTKVSGIEEWDVSGLNSYNVFSYAGSVDADISGWSNTVPGTYLVKAFHSASENIRGIENWDLKNNTNLAETFKQSNVNADISGWDFEKASNLDDMIHSSSMSIDNLEKLLARLASQNVINNVDFDMNGVFHTTDSDVSYY